MVPVCLLAGSRTTSSIPAATLAEIQSKRLYTPRIFYVIADETGYWSNRAFPVDLEALSVIGVRFSVAVQQSEISIRGASIHVMDMEGRSWRHMD